MNKAYLNKPQKFSASCLTLVVKGRNKIQMTEIKQITENAKFYFLTFLRVNELFLISSNLCVFSL